MTDDRARAGLRVGLFAHRLAARRPTGVGRYFHELVRALDRTANAATLVVSSTPEDDDPEWLPPRVRKAVVRWPRRSVQVAWCLGGGPRLERSLGPLHVVHLLQPFPPVRTSAPQVVTVHDLFPLEHPSWYSRSDGWLFRRSIDLVVRRSRTIVVPSMWVAEQVKARLRVDDAQVTVVPLGVSGAFSSACTDTEVSEVCRSFGVSPGRFAICVGTVSTRKNVVTVVRAVADLPRADLPLVIVGPDGHGADEVDAEVARAGRRAKIVRTGFLPDRDLAALVQGAGVLVHPALGEGFGFVPLEAMAVGTPVVASRTASIPEIVGNAAVLVDEPTEPALWTQALTHLVEDDERRAGLARAGLRRAAQFSWGETARRMIAIYHEVAR